MKNLKYYGYVEVDYLLEELKKLPDTEWLKSDPNSKHPDSKGVLIKFPDLRTYNKDTATEEADKDSIFYPAYYQLKALPKILDRIMEATKGTHLAWASIISLKPNGKILEHEDTTKLPEDYKRIHVPLQTNDECILTTGGQDVHMHQGQIWWFNNRISHQGYNNGSTDRIHLVLDIKGE